MATSIDLSPARQRQVTAKLLDYWSRQPAGLSMPRNIRVLIGDFQVQSQRAYELLSSDSPVDLASQGIWLVGSPTIKGNPALWPIVTASATADSDGGLKAELRLALLSDENSVLTARGWRFDLPEQDQLIISGKSGAANVVRAVRPMGHVQPINSWHRNGECRCVIHPHKDADEACNARSSVIVGASSRGFALPIVNETHPAFPLPARTLPGLAAAMILSLYGAIRAEEIIEGSRIRTSAGATIQKDLAFVFGRNVDAN